MLEKVLCYVILVEATDKIQLLWEDLEVVMLILFDNGKGKIVCFIDFYSLLCAIPI